MMPQIQDTIIITTPAVTQPHCMAKALYDNIAESHDELAFRKGEILTVLEQNTGGYEGWWLCSLRGRQGICPGNRLRLLIGQYDSGVRESSTSPISAVASTQELDITPELTCLQRQGKRRSWNVQPNKVITPKKINDIYLYDQPPPSIIRYTPSPVQQTPTNGTCGTNYFRYDVPPGDGSTGTLCSSRSTPDDCSYDVPPRAVPVNYDTPRSWRSSPAPPLSQSSSPAPPPCTESITSMRRRDSIDSSSYDVPRPLLLSQQQLTPSSSASSLNTTTTGGDSLSSSNRSSLANMPDYDVPKPRSTPVSNSGPQLHLHQLPQNTQQQSTMQQSFYDVPASNPQPKELPLELSSALETLDRLQTETTSAIGRLLGFVSPQWRMKDKLEPKVMDIKLAAVRLRTSLHDLAEFGEGTLGNAARAPDKGLSTKLRPLVKALRDANSLIQKAAATLDSQDWSIDTLSRSEEHDDSLVRPPDALDQLVACARALTEDVRQIASFIQGNSTLLFKRAVSPQVNNNQDWLEDYDYVNLESREAAAKKHAEIRDCLPSELKKSYDALIQNAESAAMANDTKVDPHADHYDKRVLTFYAAQVITHSNHLTHAIDAFLQTVEHNQPPKVFLAYSKFVVLSAHKLVHIGDTVHRNVAKNNIKTHILNCANALSEALAGTVTKTKRAALQFPSVTAVQEMVDAVVDISHLARDLKISLVQAAQQS